MLATATLTGPGRCQQVWCPVCALAALVSGEQHPLVTVIADHSVALMAVIRSMATAAADTTQPEPPGDHEATGPAPAGEQPTANGSTAANGRYHDIPVIVEPVVDQVIVEE